MENILNPYIPQKKVKSVLVDYRVDLEIQNELVKDNIEIIKTCKIPDLYEAIDGHPDIHMHFLSKDLVVVAPNAYSFYLNVLAKKGFAVIKGDTWLNRNYPDNIAYNILRISNLAFHNSKFTDKQIKLQFEKMSIKLIHVKQGYTKCSVCILNDHSAITTDIKIHNEFEKNNIDSLFINPEGILLKGLNYGFIGGTSGLINKSTLAVTGQFTNLKDYKKILDFINQKGLKVKQLSKKQIIDIGSIIPLTY